MAPGVVPVSVCQNGSVTLNATPSAGGSLNWYGTSATGGTASANAPSVSTSAPSTSTYYVSQSINGCEGPRASINVTVNALPAAPGVTNLTYCLQTPDQPAQNVGALTAVGTGLKWYNVEGSPLNAAPVPSIGQAGVQTFKVSQTLNNCESPQATLQVTVGTTATPTVASPNLAYCQFQQSQPLQATAETGASLRWVIPGLPASTTAPTPHTNIPGNQTFSVYQIGQSGCYSQRASINITIKALPAPPVVTSVSFCNTSAASQLTANGQNLKWYDAADKLLDVAPTPATSATGTQTFRVSQTVESCEGPKATLTVTIKPLPAAPGIANLNYCLQTQDQAAQN
ncbi:immunoglobulin domain-containing protein, partial [Spirosoma sp.]|uniref:immunoglobulin domain-containing protein n=1 Tax=Spirosoma sp. TaxID=1899569 RepID=UPI003B3A715C